MKTGGDRKKLVSVALGVFAALALSDLLLSSGGGPAQVTLGREWRPNRILEGAQYVGNDACAKCHRALTASQRATGMARAMETVANCGVLQSHPRLMFSEGPYSYQIVQEGNRSSYSVSNGVKTISEPILWCFGRGEAGQTYVFRHNNGFYESRVSFYRSTDKLDFTIGTTLSIPPSLEEALGRIMKVDEPRECFGCHATGVPSKSELQTDHLIAGVTCESCHGPGAKHVAEAQAANIKEAKIFNPGNLGTEELSNFCGTCHRTWEEVALKRIRGVNNVRFQPYRLANSRCYDTEDPRISCVACHNPHEEVRRDAAFYDAKCLACHQPRTGKAEKIKHVTATCPIESKLCTTCHMPKYEPPGAHFKFADHHIRVVKSNEPYPN